MHSVVSIPENPWAASEGDLLTSSRDNSSQSTERYLEMDQRVFQDLDRHKMDPIDLQEDNGPFFETGK